MSLKNTTILTDFEKLRPLLESYAYNILGSYEDAQDVVQDIFLKQLDTPSENIENPKNYFIKSVVNRSVNLKKRQVSLRKNYPGVWLPEPIATEGSDHHLQLSEILNYSLLVLMEKLNPKERAVFILKEAFHYAHDEIAEVLTITQENSRKLLSRARKALEGKPLENSAAPSNLLQQYFTAIQQGDVEKLEALMKEEVTLSADSGGKASSSRKTLFGREFVRKFLLGLARKTYHAFDVEVTTINHQPAVLFYLAGELVTCQIFEIQDNQIQNFYLMRNPDKLKFLKKNQ